MVDDGRRSSNLDFRTSPLLSVRDLVIDFTGEGASFRALDGVSFDIAAGQTMALVGESGSGKSVTAQAILRLLPKSARIANGAITFLDPASNKRTEIASLAADGAHMRALRGGRIAMIFQEPMTSFSPLHTVGDQVSEALQLHGKVSKREARKQSEAVFARVGCTNPAHVFDTYPFELSGGMRQRAMIAMALICRPALLIADEPTTALDVTTQAQILDLMRDLQRETGMAILLITHDLGVVANMADTMAVMYRGRIVESGTRDALFRDPRHPYLKALLKAVPRFGMLPDERLTPIREVVTAVPSSRAIEAPLMVEPVLTIDNVSKVFARRAGFLRTKVGEVRAVANVSLSVPQGKTLGLVGESGCGKTTLSKIVMHAMLATEGRVLFNDGNGPRDITHLSGADLLAFRRNVQFVFQDPFSSLNPRMTVFELLTEPLIIHGVGNADERSARAVELIELVGLERKHLRRYPHSFSGGQRQRLGIARALALHPRVLLCDEPVSALDVSVQAQVLNLLKDLQEAMGLSYLFVSHNLAVVDYIADEIAVMCRGHIVEQAPKHLLFANPHHPYTRALLAAVPSPDLNHPLDFAALRNSGFSDPAQWPIPFRLLGAQQGIMQDLGEGHRVRIGAHVIGEDMEEVA
ncbi:ABC transporter ATP-binding protein [Pseudochelatococcus sp. G4_1912]|uniref:ABC transporter ATP-binding protein n=1 Tax=Pseudochelatococcus sp. G4_1912 TaxID=3114288 RepID=UPI0039C6DEBD